MKKEYKITIAGKADLEKELEELVARRGDVADKISEARDFGDLSENAEYDAAREEQGLLETRIAEIEDIITNATIIQSAGSHAIGVGSKVELKTGDKLVAYTIVGPIEADPLQGRISDESPMGMALHGKKVDDTVTITTPKGEIVYTVVSIS